MADIIIRGKFTIQCDSIAGLSGCNQPMSYLRLTQGWTPRTYTISEFSCSSKEKEKKEASE